MELVSFTNALGYIVIAGFIVGLVLYVRKLKNREKLPPPTTRPPGDDNGGGKHPRKRP